VFWRSMAERKVDMFLIHPYKLRSNGAGLSSVGTFTHDCWCLDSDIIRDLLENMMFDGHADQVPSKGPNSTCNVQGTVSEVFGRP
jgi:hypothetical protein